MTVRIQGKKWKVRFEVPPKRKRRTIKGKVEGLCHYPSRTIYVTPAAPDAMRSVLLHELLHARFPDLEEAAVVDFELIYADALKSTRL